MDAHAKWALFLKRASCRFEAWWLGLDRYRATTVGVPDAFLAKDLLPPLDVAMMWHSYALNPRTYYSDNLLRPGLRSLAAFPLCSIAAQVDPACVPRLYSYGVSLIPVSLSFPSSTHAYALTSSQEASFRDLTGGLAPDLPSVTSFKDGMTLSSSACLLLLTRLTQRRASPAHSAA